jgi:hypothetical protein
MSFSMSVLSRQPPPLRPPPGKRPENGCFSKSYRNQSERSVCQRQNNYFSSTQHWHQNRSLIYDDDSNARSNQHKKSAHLQYICTAFESYLAIFGQIARKRCANATDIEVRKPGMKTERRRTVQCIPVQFSSIYLHKQCH